MNVRDVNETHAPSLRSWVVSANEPGADFPIQNLPFGVFRRAGTSEDLRGGVAIGDAVLDLAALHESALWRDEAAEVLAYASRAPLNDFMALGHAATHTLRAALSRALGSESRVRADLESFLVPQAAAELALPAHIGDYTDFYSSRYHARAVGRLFRPDEPLLENYAWIPIGYHGRASSIVVSNTQITWPFGQRRTGDSAAPTFGRARCLDYELELGLYIGRGNPLGSPIEIALAEDSIFGMCLLNDWSARDVQAWEYQPLGPFLGKSFATTVSPWIVTLEALAPFRVPLRREANDPAPLDYLTTNDASLFSIDVSAALATARMRAANTPAHALARSNYADAFWTPAQLVTHHASNGCNLRTGDLLGTGTLSGPRPEAAGSLMELTQAGRVTLDLPNGETRGYLEAGDEIVLRANAALENARPIGFGPAVGIVERALSGGA